ncbi:2-aminoethylphosphonate ABC transporter substrate-binding protein [Rugosimonospora acidiphila]|uniref:2-aminoethylphosphonate ABC transporter substrate-binding protein n=1 Tax=Rugosimonospora acidiphila TaxID=556531 RepID=A0ABP9RWV9_9ACTN
MRRVLTSAAVLAAAALVASACGSGTGASASTKSGGDDKTVTIYSADGLADWYQKQFAAFTAQTGIKVQYVEAGSGEVVSRMEKEKANPQADVLVTLPPYIQDADKNKLLAANTVPGQDKVTGASTDYVPLVNNYLCFIYNPDVAKPAPTTWDDLLNPRFAKKLEYSTPGEAGDGTAVLLQLQHDYGKQGALDYLKKLETNNVGQSASTGKLEPEVSNGQLAVANGDVQMNLSSINTDKSNFKLFFPAKPGGTPSTFALPYVMGLAAGAPHADAGKKLEEFLLSTQAQTDVSSQAYGIPVRSDVTPTDANAQVVEQTLKGVTVWSPDWNQILADQDSDLAAYKQALGLS